MCPAHYTHPQRHLSLRDQRIETVLQLSNRGQSLWSPLYYITA